MYLTNRRKRDTLLKGTLRGRRKGTLKVPGQVVTIDNHNSLNIACVKVSVQVVIFGCSSPHLPRSRSFINPSQPNWLEVAFIVVVCSSLFVSCSFINPVLSFSSRPAMVGNT